MPNGPKLLLNHNVDWIWSEFHLNVNMQRGAKEICCTWVLLERNCWCWGIRTCIDQSVTDKIRWSRSIRITDWPRYACTVEFSLSYCSQTLWFQWLTRVWFSKQAGTPGSLCAFLKLPSTSAFLRNKFIPFMSELILEQYSWKSIYTFLPFDSP